MDRDPRVTKIGRFIREAGIDELPQLINVIRGEISLVGPRPALPSEVATFPAALRAREQALPGVTGLYQVEARDKPSFEAYRWLDLFYVENWSTTLDLMIILSTRRAVLRQGVQQLAASPEGHRTGGGLDAEQAAADAGCEGCGRRAAEPGRAQSCRCRGAGRASWCTPTRPVTSSNVQVITDLSESPWPGERAVITIGAYDGVHRGHRAVIADVMAIAKDQHCRSVVVTFDRHPASIVRPESAPNLLTDLDQKLELLGETGVDATVLVRFDEAQAFESATDFVERVLVHCLATRTIVVGEDFHFGRQRSGNVALLRELGAVNDFEVSPRDLVPRSDGVEEPISSTAIRRALAGGQVELAAGMLGRSFEARGPVVHGDERGRLLGFPTANVEVPNKVCIPADGVYAGVYVRPDGSEHPCAINLGRRPTFYEHADHSLLEAHLLDFDGNLYDETARVRFTHFLRSERKFDGMDALVIQLKQDIEHARAVALAD
jgi:riboflavin kinase/FMN adenylyltransferase